MEEVVRGAARKANNSLPRNDEKLPNGSIIHWTKRDPEQNSRILVTCGQCHKTRLVTPQSRKSKPEWSGLCRNCAAKYHDQDESLPTGSIIHWGKRDSNKPLHVMVTCGGCGRKRFTRPLRGSKRKPWTGLCWDCKSHGQRKSEDEKLSTGSIIHWSDRSPNNRKLAMVTCGRCGKKRMTRLPLHKDRRRFTGFCSSCGHTQHLKDEHLPNNSILHWTERHPENPNKRIMATCGGCGLKRWTYLYRTDTKWTGFCPKCARKARAKNSYMREGRDQSLPSGSIIHWGERDPNNSERVMVTCCLCGKKRMTKIQYKRRWTGICFEHRSAAGIIEIARGLKQTSGNGQENGGASSSSGGRPPQSTTVDYHATISDAISALLDLMKSKKKRAIRRKHVTQKYKLAGEYITPDNFSQRLNTFLQMGFEEFLDHVASGWRLKEFLHHAVKLSN